MAQAFRLVLTFIGTLTITLLVVRAGRAMIAADWKPVPVYVEMKTTMTAPGIEKRELRRIYAVRSDGASVQQNVIDQNGVVKTFTSLNLPSVKRSYLFYSDSNLISTMPFNPCLSLVTKHQPRCEDLYQSGRGWKDLGDSKISRINVVLYERRDHVMRSKFSVAPSLSCFILSRLDTWGRAENDPGAETIQRPLAVVLGEPTAGLFEVPKDKTESPPSALLTEVDRLDGISTDLRALHKYQRLDRDYWMFRKDPNRELPTEPH